MKPALLAAALLAGSCASAPPAPPLPEPPPEPAPPPGSPVASLAGLYRVVEAIGPDVASSGPRLGGVVAVRADELVLYNGEGSWNRMPVSWTTGGGSRAAGVYPGAEVGPQLVRREDGKLVVSDSGIPLALASRLSGDEERAARRTLAALPSLEAMRARLRSCLDGFAALRPEDPSFRRVDPRDVQNTGAALATLQLVQQALAMRCQAVPKPCAVPPTSAKARQMLEQAQADCRAAHPRP